ncbi:MAG: serine hydrolase [Candidatus Omnitrophota bacterium]
MKKLPVVLIGIAVALAVAIGVWHIGDSLQKAKTEKAAIEKQREVWRVLKKSLDGKVARFRGVAGIVIEDLKTRERIVYNNDTLFPSASIVKIPIMGACFKAVKEGRVKLTDTVVLRASQRAPGSGKLKYSPAGSMITIQELMRRMVCESDNTAANILIGMLGFDYLNAAFKEFGLKNTNLSRKMMDFQCRSSGIENYTTPDDMARILEAIYEKRFLDPSISGQCLAILKMQKIKDRIPAKLPATTVVAHKTGLERSVCHDVGIVFTAKGDLLICMLTKGVNGSRLSKDFISLTVKEAYDRYCAAAS